MYKGLDFLQINTVMGLKPPTEETQAVRLVDLTTAQYTLSQAIALGNTTEAQARESGLTSLETQLAAQIATLEAAYETADTNLANQLNTQVQAIISGFTIKDPVYAIVNENIALTGLSIDSQSFTGDVPANARILTIARGGSVGVAHADNRIWIAKDGVWVAATDFNDAAEIVRSILISVENGADNFVNTIYSLIEPAIFTNTTVGTTPLRWARWQGNDRVVADGTSLARTGITFSARLESADLIVNSSGIAINPTMKALLQDLSSATGLLPVAQVEGLLAFILSARLDQLTAPNTAVSFANQKLSNVADPTLALDAVNLQTYQAGVVSLQTQVDARDFYADLTSGTVTGVDTIFTITHGLSSMKVMKEVFDKTTGESVDTDFVRVVSDLNSCQVIFRNNASVSASQYGLLLHKVA